MRAGTDGTPEMDPNMRQILGKGFSKSEPGGGEFRSPPGLEAVADGMKENFSCGRFAPGTRFPELWGKGI